MTNTALIPLAVAGAFVAVATAVTLLPSSSSQLVTAPLVVATVEPRIAPGYVDIDGSGKIDFADFSLMLKYWNQQAASRTYNWGYCQWDGTDYGITDVVTGVPLVSTPPPDVTPPSYRVEYPDGFDPCMHPVPTP